MPNRLASCETVGVIDVGSNTIKLLIAKRGDTLPVKKLEFHVEETRIGEGMTGHPPTIDADAIQRGTEAIKRLVDACSACDAICIVATSAVRDASNKQAFVNAVERACGHELRILSGDEEAKLIGLALKCDPQLHQLDSYTLIDLGGGSLECIQFSDRKTIKAQSLKIGSVRLASLLLENRLAPLAASDERRIRDYARERWNVSIFKYQSSPSEVAVLTGGAAKHLADNLSKKQRAGGLPFADFVRLKNEICSIPAEERVERFRIPASRSDIFPTAMVTLDESLRFHGCEILFFSDYNLRFGVATTLLAHGRLRTA